MKKLYLFLLAIFLLTFVSATSDFLGNFDKNQPILITQLCGTCTYNNITSITAPTNNSMLVANVSMARSGSQYSFLLPANNTNQLGDYNVNGVGDINGQAQAFQFRFHIGKELTTGQAVIYTLLLISVFIVFALCCWFAIAIPFSNEVGASGSVIAVTKYKYLKLGFILLSYNLFIWFLNTLIALSDNFLRVTVFFGFINMVFFILMKISLYFDLSILVIMLYNVVKDFNYKKQMKDLVGMWPK